MAIGNLWGIYGVTVGKSEAVQLGGITDVSGPTGTVITDQATSGSVYPRFQAISGHAPTFNFTTLGIAAALAQAGAAGLQIEDSGIPSGLIFYGQKWTEGGARTAGATAYSYTITKGFLAPGTLSASGQGDATLNYTATAVYDGTADIIEINDAGTCPTVTDTERFALGPVTLESLALDGVTNLDIDFGITLEVRQDLSDVNPTWVSIKEIRPVITLRGSDITWAKSTDASPTGDIPPTGLAMTHTNTTIYLRKRAEGGTFELDATAEHVKITAAGLITVDTSFSGSGNEPAETVLRIPLKYDGTNAPMVITTASAIT